MAIRGDSAGREKSYLLDMLAGGAGRILEVGCGDGRLTRKYAGAAARVAGIDLPAALAGAKAEGGINLAAASGIALPFRAGSFDQVIFSLSF